MRHVFEGEILKAKQFYLEEQKPVNEYENITTNKDEPMDVDITTQR